MVTLLSLSLSLSLFLSLSVRTYVRTYVRMYVHTYIHTYIPQIHTLHVQSDNHMGINSSVNRKHMFDLTSQTNNSTLQAGLIVIKMKLNALSVIDGTMIENITTSQQD